MISKKAMREIANIINPIVCLVIVVLSEFNLSIMLLTSFLGIYTLYINKVLSDLAKEIVSRANSEKKVKRLAYYDSLTNLPNRKNFEYMMDIKMFMAKEENKKLAVIFIDLEKFKPANDKYGHEVGDRLLISVAQRLRGAVKQEDGLCRLGGDEFLILLYDIKSIESTLKATNRISDLFVTPFIIDGIEINLTASIGISIFPDHARTRKELISCSDRAMYKAKAKKINHVEVFSED